MRFTYHNTIGADDMAFPRLNALSYWLYLAGGLIMVASFFVEGGIFLVGLSSTLGAINVLVTIVHCRAPGVTFARLPFFVWSQLVTALLLLLAFPALQAAAIFQLMDRIAGTSFFMASGLVVGGVPLQGWQTHMTYAAIALGLFQIPFVWNLFASARKVERARAAAVVRADTRMSSSALGMWLFLASEAMFFASLFSGYVMLRAGASEWPAAFGGFPWLETVLLVGASAAFGPSRVQLMAANALGLAFVAVTILNDAVMIGDGQTPAANLMLATWFTLTAVHAFHVLAGAVFSGWLAGPAFRMASEQRERWTARIRATRRYWLFVDLVWLLIVAAFYF